MKSIVLIIIIGSLALSNASPAAEMPDSDANVSRDVGWVLGYQLPDYDCVRPKLNKSNQVAGKTDRHRRKITRYASCVKLHQADLIKHHQRIVVTVEEGITKQQSEVFISKLKLIQDFIETSGAEFKLTQQDDIEISRVMRMGNRPSL
jgi:hypothetical protein